MEIHRSVMVHRMEIHRSVEGHRMEIGVLVVVV
jgi:hypothetical protein